MIEPTFAVEGGTPVDALEHVLNEMAEDGYRFAGIVPVREAVTECDVEKILAPVQVVVMELVDGEGDA